jgi:hypothetical protein
VKLPSVKPAIVTLEAGLIAIALSIGLVLSAVPTTGLAQTPSPFRIPGPYASHEHGGEYNGVVVMATPRGVDYSYSIIYPDDPPLNFSVHCFFPRLAINTSTSGGPVGIQTRHDAFGRISRAFVHVGGSTCARSPEEYGEREDSIETPNDQVAESLLAYINCGLGITCGQSSSNRTPTSLVGRRPSTKPSAAPAKSTAVAVWVEDGPSLPAPYNSGVFFIRLSNQGQTTVRFDSGTVYDCVNIANCQMAGSGFIVTPGSTITIATLMSPQVCTDPLNDDGTPMSNACAQAQARQPSFQYTYHYTVIK